MKVDNDPFKGRIYICRKQEEIGFEEPWNINFPPMPQVEDNGPLKTRQQSRLEKAIREGYFKACNDCAQTWDLLKWK